MKMGKEKIQELIDQMLDEKVNYGFYLKNAIERSRWLMQADIAEQITNQYGNNAISPVMEKLRTLKEHHQLILEKQGIDYDDSAITRLIQIIINCSETKDQAIIMEILFWDEICPCPNIQTCLLQTLKRIGDDATVKSLKDYAEKIKNTEYQNISFYEDNQIKIDSITNNCLDDNDDVSKCTAGIEKNIMESFNPKRKNK
jgi:hypothetical protein